MTVPADANISEIILRRYSVCDSREQAIMKRLNLPLSQPRPGMLRLLSGVPVGLLHFSNGPNRDEVEKNALKVSNEKNKLPCITEIHITPTSLENIRGKIYGIVGQIAERVYLKNVTFPQLLKGMLIGIQVNHLSKIDLETLHAEVGFITDENKFEYRPYSEWQNQLLLEDPEINHDISRV